MSIEYLWELRDASNDRVIASGNGLPPTSDTPGSALVEGSYYLWVEATDESGTSSESSSVVVFTPESNPGGPAYPDPSQVAAGIQYGPNGDDYTGTMVASDTVGVLLIGVQQ